MIDTDIIVRQGALGLVSLLLHIFVEEGGSTLSAVVTIMVLRHEASNPSNRTVLPQPNNLTAILNPVILEGLKGNSLGHTLHLLGLGVDLLFPLLSSSAKTKDKVKGGLLLDVVIREGATIFELLPSEDETLLIRGNSFLILDLRLDVVDGVRGLDIEGDGLACVIVSISQHEASAVTRCVPADGARKDGQSVRRDGQAVMA